MNRRNRRKALIEGGIAGILFGTASIFIRLLGVLNVYSIAFWRLIIGSLVLFAIILIQKQSFRISAIRENFRSVLPLGVLIGIHFILFASAVRDTTILNATVLVNTAPIFSMIISTLVFRIKPSKLALLGLVISFFGSGLIALGDATTSFSVNLKGDIAAMLAALAEGFYLNYGRKIRHKLPLLQVMLFIYLISAMAIGVSSVLIGVPILLPNQLKITLMIIGLGTLPTAIGHTLYFSSLSYLKSFETSSLALVEPLGATLLGIIFLNEMPKTYFVFGATSVLFGIGLVISKD